MEDFPVNSDYEQDVDLANLGENEDSQDLASSEQDEATRQAAEIEQRKVGAKVLAAAGFRARHSETVDTSFERARTQGESLVGEKDERRVDAYLKRIDAGIKERGSRFEQKLWGQTLESLTIRAEDFSDSYWEAKKKEYALRSGVVVDELPADIKAEYVKTEQNGQRVELREWMDYLSQEPYPTWFKVYAIDGVSKMGISPTTGESTKRRKGDVYAYPNFDAAILNEVYDAIADFYGLSGDTQQSPDDPVDESGRTVRDSELEALVKSGNFAKLWAHFDTPDRVISTPERAEDVRGEWVEYGLDQAKEISNAARGIEKGGQGWCVVSVPVARHYMARGEYGHLEDYDDKDRQSKGKFILFHLQDEQGRKTSSACASIRLGVDGNVAEISGKCKGQALPESLLDVVEEKVKTLPGGEEFMPAFKDDKRLVRLFETYLNDGTISYEDLRFIYQVDRPISSLGKYRSEYDDRAAKLRAKYGVDAIIDSCAATGADVREFISKLSSEDIANSLDKLLATGLGIDEIVTELDDSIADKNATILLTAGANADVLVSNLPIYAIMYRFDELIAAGANVDKIVGKLDSSTIAGSLDRLLAAGANIDIDELIRELDDYAIAKNLDKLLAVGARIDVDSLLPRLRTFDIVNNLDKLLAAGAKVDVDSLIPELNQRDIILYFDELLAAGADADVLLSKLKFYDIIDNLKKFLAAGVSANVLLSKIPDFSRTRVILENLDILLAAKADINVDELISDLGPHAIMKDFDKLIAAGADEAQLRAIIDGYNE